MESEGLADTGKRQLEQGCEAMKHYKYLIVGGGMAADAAARGIRELDSNGTLGLISSESEPPYDRPPLSKDLWKGKPLAKIWRHTPGT